MAPLTFSGNFVNAYNGKIQFTIIHTEVSDSNAKKVPSPDIILQAKCGHYLSWEGTMDGDVSVSLNEFSGWKDSRTGRPTTAVDMLGVLNHLKTIMIRGGFYASAETTTIRDVSIMPGKASYPCCILGSIDVCSKQRTGYGQPSDLVHYCEGSFRKQIKVTRVEPRFARRTGGATITIHGENFGLSGSDPIVRINNRRCQKTFYPTSTYLNNLNSHGVPSAYNTMLNNLDSTGVATYTSTGFLATGPTSGNPAGNALVNSFNAATDSFKSIYPEHCWNGMQDDGTDKGFNYGTPTAAKYINQGETGIDTGGPCFPSHCSSCPDNTKSWCASNQIIAVSSGACNGRGLATTDAVLACAASFPYVNYPRLCPDDAEKPLRNVVVTKPPASGYAAAPVRTSAAGGLTSTDTAFDFMDIRATNLFAAVAVGDTTITVTSSLALTCTDLNLATRDCTTAAVGGGLEYYLIENYIKLVDLSSSPPPTEVMKVIGVNANVLTVQRGQGGTTAIAANTTSKVGVYLCGKIAECLASTKDLTVGRRIKIDDEVMAVKNVAAIGSVTTTVNSCGAGSAGANPFLVSCTSPCVFSTKLKGWVSVSATGALLGITVTDPGSGYDPNHLPTIAAVGSCTLTPWWSSVVVTRAAAGTKAAAHGGVATVTRLNCLDDDETGENCGGSCKPCAETVKGPQEHSRLLCITPEAPFDDPKTDLEVTVEAASGPTDSPYQVRMDPKLQKWTDTSTRAVSCVTAASRGFSFGAHDFAWGLHFRTASGSAHVTTVSVDENNGEVYVMGTMQGTIYIEGKHVMTKAQMGSLTVSPATSAWPLTATCTGAINMPYIIAGTGNDDCGRASFIAQFSRDGRPNWLNMIETKLPTAAGSVTAQAVITDSSFDAANSELYLVGYYSDGMIKTSQTLASSTTLTMYDVDPKTRVSSTATPSATLAAQATSSTNRYYQEGFIAKYSRAGTVVWVKAVGYATALPHANSGLGVNHLRVVAYKASTSNRINTQLTGQGAPPTLPTQTSRKDIEYDTGVAQAAVQGGTGTEASITLKATSSSTDKWYVGLMVKIVEGPGYGQQLQIYEYSGSTKVARVKGRWDPNDIPTKGSKYVILGGRPSSWLSGMHWSNGGVYVSAQIHTVCGVGCAAASSARGATTVVIGEMPTAYRDSNAAVTSKMIEVGMGQDDHQTILAQFDVTGRVFWARAVGINGFAGAITAVTSTTVASLAATASSVDSYYIGCTVTVIDGTGAGQSRIITAYTGATRTFTVGTAFGTSPAAGSRVIIANKGSTGTATAGSATTLTLPTTPSKYAMDGAFNGSLVIITGGTGEGQVARVQSHLAGILTITTLATAADSTSTFHILDNGLVEDLAAMDDKVFLTGLFRNPGLRLQNCSFDAATVLEGPPANTQPTVVFECAVNGGLPVVSNDGTKAEYLLSGSTSTDVSVGTVGTTTTTMAIFTAAYNGSGSLVWLQYASEGAVRPRAIASLSPSIGAKALRGEWGGTKQDPSVPGRNQVPYGSAAKDVGSEHELTAVAHGGWIVVAGEVYDHTNAADFGRTYFPRTCSAEKTVGEKGVSTARLKDTPCAGQVVALATVANWWPTGTKNTPVSDVILVIYRPSTGDVLHIRRTGQKDASESATSVAVHAATGAVFVAGEYFLKGIGNWQGSSGTGEDVFGMAAADRSQALGCPRSRLTGANADPYCQFYSHGAATERPTGYVAKFNFNGDETNRGNLNRRLDPSVTGYIEATASTLAACTGGSPDTNGANHVLTGSSACSTHLSGCSCLSLVFTSRTMAAGTVDADSSSSPYGAGPLSMFSGMKIRITDGRSMGYEGIISAYTVASHIYNVIPALPSSLVDETSKFQLFPWSQFTPRNHLNSCDKFVDQGCSAYGVEWVKTVGTSVGASNAAFFPQSTPRGLATMDSDVYVAGSFAGFVGTPAFGIEGVDESPGSASMFRSLGAIQAANGGASGSYLSAVSSATAMTLATGYDYPVQVDYYRGLYLVILEGPGAGETQLITSYTAASVVHVEPGFVTTPTTSSRYIITNQAAGGFVGGSTSTTVFTLAINAGDIADSTYFSGTGMRITFVAGPLAGQTRSITGYVPASREVTVSSALTAAPSTSDQYVIYFVAGYLSQADSYVIKLQD
eukprot:CAMPEP_0113729228 /NCGR_PEP_ID=MMETSP0038_2-20120614/42415_1 /TAXON_ID=2898 /ORGANISM="Cryptomonas paramecium" /LENGTH=2134 /DNA_ID=CAMNT_0000661011 /DNA_START=259 /DNA_END=6663 /DNA_ORIENTATION=+ /assembly_acc=CAM_ASM_000170